jgi:hypothetical protein
MGNPDDERLKPHNKIDCEENIEGLFQQRTDVLGKCDIVRMLLESPNRDKHELHIINGRALVEQDIRWLERQIEQYKSIDDFMCSRFLNETLDKVIEAKQEWDNLEKKDSN